MLFKQTTEGFELCVKVVPKAGSNKIVGWEENELKICLKALPIKGEANEGLVQFLAKTLGIAKSQVEIVIGKTSRHKRLLIKGVTLEQLNAVLKPSPILAP